MNKIYIVATTIIIIIALLLLLYRKQRNQINLQDTIYLKNIGIHFICLCLNIIYLILLCAKVNPYYIKRSYVLFGIIFYLIVITASSFAYIINVMPNIAVIIPLLLYLLLFETVIDGKTFAEFNVPQYSGKQIKVLDNYYINQIIDADKSGLTEVEIHVAKHPSDVWPLGIQSHSDKIPRSLYNHGLISRIISTSMIADDMVNKTYHLPE